MTLKFTLVLLLVFVVFGAESDEYIDTVINILMTGDSIETDQSSEDGGEEQPLFIDGIWKCGECDGVDESNPMYSEENHVETNISSGQPVVQVGLSLDGMKCITVAAEASSVVRRITGACVGDSVTLDVSSGQDFTVRVYG